MTPVELLAVCHHCPRKQLASGRLLCDVDRVPCQAHATSDDCPQGFYVPGATLSIGKANVYRPIAGPDAASPRLILAREMICARCEHATKANGRPIGCNLCGCTLGGKIRDVGSACPAEKWGPPTKPERWFSHTGAIGDVIYALHAIRAAGGGSLYLHHDASIRAKHYMRTWHEAALAPLLKLQPYLTHFELVDQWPTATHRLDTFRDLGLQKNDLVSLHHMALGLTPPTDIDPWLTVDRPNPIAPVVFHRSHRYRNREGDALWARIVAKYPDAVFVGLKKEHADFCDRFGDVPYHPTADLLELARVIAGAKLFCGNQSSPFAIAAALGVPTVLEVDPHIPDCCFNRPNATHAWTRDAELPELDAPPVAKETIHHVFHDLDLTGHADKDRVHNARCTWGWTAGIDRAWELMPFTPIRTSKWIGDTRAVPYLRDLFDAAAERAGGGIVVWSNLDVCLVPEASAAIRQKLTRGDCCFSRRVDVKDAKPNLTRLDLHGAKVHGGTDLFAFRAGWWRRTRERMPDMFIACEAFDFVLRHLMLADYPLAEISPPILYHQEHEAFWADPKNIADNPAQQHNRQLAATWCRANGFGAAMFGEGSEFLLREDGDVMESNKSSR